MVKQKSMFVVKNRKCSLIQRKNSSFSLSPGPKACEPGTHSEKITDRKGDTQICVPCEVGTSQASGASLSCKACKAGRATEKPERKHYGFWTKEMR